MRSIEKRMELREGNNRDIRYQRRKRWKPVITKNMQVINWKKLKRGKGGFKDFAHMCHRIVHLRHTMMFVFYHYYEFFYLFLCEFLSGFHITILFELFKAAPSLKCSETGSPPYSRPTTYNAASRSHKTVLLRIYEPSTNQTYDRLVVSKFISSLVFLFKFCTNM